MKKFIGFALTSCVAFTLGCFARLAFDFHIVAREAARQHAAELEAAGEVASSGTSEEGIQKEVADFNAQGQKNAQQKVTMIDSMRPAILNFTNRDCMSFSGTWIPKISEDEWHYLTNFFKTTNMPLVRMVDNTKVWK